MSDIVEITPDSEFWPQGLSDLSQEPNFAGWENYHELKRLWVRGNLEALTGKSVAITGARAATAYGAHLTIELTSDFVRAGYTIVSGLAYGVDGIAHRAALAEGGQTIAYLPGGVDRPYPAGHNELAARIIDAGGALVSEWEPGIVPIRHRFLQRARLVAAHAQALLITEAAVRSGSINTARWARALGRTVGAVPGPLTSPASSGCHALIQEGFPLITSAEDVLQRLE